MNYAKPYNSAIQIYKPLEEPGVKPGMYEISSIGNVRNVQTRKLLSQAVSYKGGGYRSVGLQMEDNSRKVFPVHRLVASTFVPKTKEDIELGRNTVNHMDCITDHNEALNLEWTTLGENTVHGINAHHNEGVPVYSNEYREANVDSDWADGYVTAGTANGMSRLTEDQVRQICQMLQDGYKRPEIARTVLDGTTNDYFIIRDIHTRKRWGSISKDYDF